MRAAAEALPFADDSFDAAMACMTIHHWADLHHGLAELRRVARSRVVVLTWDPDVAAQSWLTEEYLPELHQLDVFRFASPESIGAALGTHTIEVIPIPADCQDGFIEAWWARPEAYLDPVVRDGCSGFRALDPGVVTRAMTRLEADLASGEWDRRHGRLRALAEADLGYRLVVAQPA